VTIVGGDIRFTSAPWCDAGKW